MSKNNNTTPQKKNRSIHISSTVSMSMVLFLIGLVSLLYFVARDLSVFVKENINLSIVLDDGVNKAYSQRIENYLEDSPFAKSVEYVSKEDALKDHIESLGENPEDFLGYNPLKASLEVKLNAKYANNDSVKMIEAKLKTFEHINQVVYQKDMVDLVNDNVSKIGFILLSIALVLLMVSVALINNTVRLGIYSNRFLINTMKLVGATSGFIRKPYLKSAFWGGLIASMISLILMAVLVYYGMLQFGMDILMIQPLTLITVSLIVIVSGIILTVVSTYFAVGRYLKMKTNDMYYI